MSNRITTERRSILGSVVSMCLLSGCTEGLSNGENTPSGPEAVNLVGHRLWLHSPGDLAADATVQNTSEYGGMDVTIWLSLYDQDFRVARNVAIVDDLNSGIRTEKTVVTEFSPRELQELTHYKLEIEYTVSNQEGGRVADGSYATKYELIQEDVGTSTPAGSG